MDSGEDVVELHASKNLMENTFRLQEMTFNLKNTTRIKMQEPQGQDKLQEIHLMLDLIVLNY